MRFFIDFAFVRLTNILFGLFGTLFPLQSSCKTRMFKTFSMIALYIIRCKAVAGQKR